MKKIFNHFNDAAMFAKSEALETGRAISIIRGKSGEWIAMHSTSKLANERKFQAQEGHEYQPISEQDNNNFDDEVNSEIREEFRSNLDDYAEDLVSGWFDADPNSSQYEVETFAYDPPAGEKYDDIDSEIEAEFAEAGAMMAEERVKEMKVMSAYKDEIINAIEGGIEKTLEFIKEKRFDDTSWEMDYMVGIAIEKSDPSVLSALLDSGATVWFGSEESPMFDLMENIHTWDVVRFIEGAESKEVFNRTGRLEVMDQKILRVIVDSVSDKDLKSVLTKPIEVIVGHDYKFGDYVEGERRAVITEDLIIIIINLVYCEDIGLLKRLLSVVEDIQIPIFNTLLTTSLLRKSGDEVANILIDRGVDATKKGIFGEIPIEKASEVRGTEDIESILFRRP